MGSETTFRSQFSDDAWAGFAQMFTAVHGTISKADGTIDDEETDLLFSIIQNEYAAVPAGVLDSFTADPALAREVLADETAIVHQIAPDDGGAAATRAADHLTEWVAASASDEIRDARASLVRGLMVEVMYLGLRTAAADGHFDRAEFEAWTRLGAVFGLPDEWLDRLRADVAD